MAPHSMVTWKSSLWVPTISSMFVPAAEAAPLERLALTVLVPPHPTHSLRFRRDRPGCLIVSPAGPVSDFPLFLLHRTLSHTMIG
jgi:hypothetical protein